MQLGPQVTCGIPRVKLVRPSSALRPKSDERHGRLITGLNRQMEKLPSLVVALAIFPQCDFG